MAIRTETRLIVLVSAGLLLSSGVGRLRPAVAFTRSCSRPAGFLRGGFCRTFSRFLAPFGAGVITLVFLGGFFVGRSGLVKGDGDGLFPLFNLASLAAF